MTLPHRLVPVLLLATLVMPPRIVWAGENADEDAFLEGDFDREDLGHLINGGAGSGQRTGASDLRGETWISVVAFGGRDPLGRDVVGGMAMVGIAFDRIATGPVHRIDARPYTFDGILQGGDFDIGEPDAIYCPTMK